jgi:predicted DNA-binding transcriptional regulator AlpA
MTGGVPDGQRIRTGNPMTPFLSTKEVAKYLCVNEKMVYTLVAEKRLPAT